MAIVIYRKELIPEVLEYAKKHGIITRGLLVREFGVARETAKLLLEYLARQGKLKKVITTKEIVYVYVGE